MPLSPGAHLGPYEVLAFIGAGGMGEVYKARDTRLGRIVAVKVVTSEKLADAQAGRRFIKEARAVSALNHPNIVLLYDFSHDAGTDFLVLEYVQGQTLKELISPHGLPLKDVLYYGVQIATALAAAHAVGIVHRDIKPANIMITPESQIKILDFGVAKVATAALGAESETRTQVEYTSPGILVGTACYMSPEQIRGEVVDARSDIFSLGSVLYQSATGRLPFQGASTLSIMNEIETVDPPAPSSMRPDLLPEFDLIVGRALEKQKDKRYNSALELAEAMDKLLGPNNKVTPFGPSLKREQTSLLQTTYRPSSTTQKAVLAAIEALRHCCCPWGMKASGRRVGHHQVWARDSMITLLGARFAEDNHIRAALRASIGVLKEHQTATGAIPNNVDCETQHPNFRAYADGGLWWIVGSTLLAPDATAVRKILRWYDCQDVDQSGLLSMQEASDWHDMFCTRGKGLYLNCLYVLALRAAAKLLSSSDRGEAEGYVQRADAAVRKLNAFFWYQGDGEMLRHVSHTFSTENRKEQDSLGRKRWLPIKRYLVGEQYYLPYLGFRAVGEWFDSLGNLLAILVDVANEEQTRLILDFIASHDLKQSPLFSMAPVVQPGDPDWREYYGMLNLPYHYHNGGIWPFIGGFYVAALVKAGRMDAATEALERLAELNLRGEFNEWHHGQTLEPMGVQDQAWSAGMYLFAVECVRKGHVPLL
jgi:serine/threonine protein kinase